MKSMTGYGAAEGRVGRGAVFVEVRSVNHRYCELQLKIPPKWNVLDGRMRKLLQRRIARGKLDLFIKEKRDVAPAVTLLPNLPLAAAYQRALRGLARYLRGPVPPLLEAVALRDLVTVVEPTVRYERFWRPIAGLIERALAQLERMRKAEGAHLKQDQLQRLRRLEHLVRRVHARAESVARRSAAAGAIGAEHGGETMARGDVGLAGTRAEITEEITRLTSHVKQYRRYCTERGAVGRQLDFLLQEMNREINTIGSKGNDAGISHLVVAAKGELEKLREQAQNIE